MKQTGKIIKERLSALGKTQEWLADIAGVSVNAVSKWTKGGSISVDRLATVASALGLTADQLLRGDDTGTVVQPAEQTWLERVTPDEKEMLDLYRALTREGKLMTKGAAKASPKEPELLAARNQK